MIKICIICGAEFSAPPSAKKVTCSPACRSERCRRQRKGNHREWSEKARARKKTAPSDAEAAQQKEAMSARLAAAMSLPESQRGPQNREALIWMLVDPEGNLIETTNLLHWCRENYRQFEPYGDPETSGNRICKGFMAIASSMRGVPSRKNRPSMSYKGWGLRTLPYREDDKS